MVELRFGWNKEQTRGTVPGPENQRLPKQKDKKKMRQPGNRSEDNKFFLWMASQPTRKELLLFHRVDRFKDLIRPKSGESVTIDGRFSIVLIVS